MKKSIIISTILLLSGCCCTYPQYDDLVIVQYSGTPKEAHDFIARECEIDAMDKVKYYKSDFLEEVKRCVSEHIGHIEDKDFQDKVKLEFKSSN